jgi:catechol 2,3-dioxygenase-like lactoylglutathione lyase family enzyme
MTLGAFSISLSVKDLNASKLFYENLGFTAFGGAVAQNYLIMKNGNALVGLFQGMFQGNILTFNPGWDENARKLDRFDDVRDIQRHLQGKNIKLDSQVEANTSGPASIVLKDPDGNVILIDQHV